MQGLTLTERAIVKLNHITLTLHYKEFRRRLDRLVSRMNGHRDYHRANKQKIFDCIRGGIR